MFDCYNSSIFLILVCSGTSPFEAASKAERLLATMSTWSMNHGLALNVQKCEALFISPFARKAHLTAQQLTVRSSSRSFIKCVHELRLLNLFYSQNFYALSIFYRLLMYIMLEFDLLKTAIPIINIEYYSPLSNYDLILKYGLF